MRPIDAAWSFLKSWDPLVDVYDEDQHYDKTWSDAGKPYVTQPKNYHSPESMAPNFRIPRPGIYDDLPDTPSTLNFRAGFSEDPTQTPYFSPHRRLQQIYQDEQDIHARLAEQYRGHPEGDYEKPPDDVLEQNVLDEFLDEYHGWPSINMFSPNSNAQDWGLREKERQRELARYN